MEQELLKQNEETKNQWYNLSTNKLAWKLSRGFPVIRTTGFWKNLLMETEKKTADQTLTGCKMKLRKFSKGTK